MRHQSFDHRAGSGRTAPPPISRPIHALLGLGSALLLLLVLAVPAAAQTGEVTGQVINQQNQQPLVGVQVSIPGTGLGTLSGQDGRFRIANVPVGSHTIRAERIGFAPAIEQITVAADAAVQLNLGLVPQALGLDEIVVTGTAGAARRREIGNTISQINVADQVRESPANMDALLQARVPGMSVTQSSGMAGGGAMIRLRGNVSMSMSNQPIVYVDGVRIRSDGLAQNVPPVGFQGRSGNDVASPLNNIDPGDIERIEVIKGAAATTLYGTEAAAGVIQIFTKRGHEGRAQWTAQVDQGVSWVRPFGPDPSERPPSEAAQTAAGGTSDFLFINPWLRNAHQQRYSLSVTGGADFMQYFVSGSLTDNDGVLPNDREERKAVRGNFTFTPLNDLQLQVNNSFTSSEIRNTPAGNNAHGITLNAFRRDRNYRGEETREAIDPILDYLIDTEITNLNSSLTATYTPTASLTNRLTFGYDQIDQNNRNFRPFGFALAPNGILSDQRVRFTTLTVDYVGTYNFGITDGLRSSFSWGGQSITTEEESTTAHGEDFPGPGLPTVSSAGSTLGFEARQRVINAGFFFQNVFDVANRLFITAGLRVDGNSAFGRDLGLETYPKASASYVISEEDFWNPDWGTVKLRAAWGQSGRAPGAFDAVRTFDPVGSGDEPAFFPLNVGNPELGPERTSEWEAGFDGSFFRDRLSVDFTWFRQITDDALFDVSQVPSMGFLSSQLENVGKLRNTGIELAANVTAIDQPSYGLDLGVSISTTNSKILSLGGAPDFELSTNVWVMEDEPAPVVRSDCIVNANEAAEPIIERDCIHGPNQPTEIIQGNVDIRLPGNLILSSRGEFQGGFFMYDGAAFNAVTRAVRWPGCFDAYRIQETQGDDAVPAKYRPGCINVAETRPDFFIYPADFFKLRELTLQAPIPAQWLPGDVSRAVLTVSGRNLFRWTKDEFKVLDPEIGFRGFDNQVREMFEHVPPPATFTASFRVVF